MYEMEDGETASGGAVRYGFDDRTFPGYSWKGYAIFSKLQVFLDFFSKNNEYVE